jgi:hypothetical protein
VGSFVGNSTVALGAWVRQGGGVVMAVDTWAGDKLTSLPLSAVGAPSAFCLLPSQLDSDMLTGPALSGIGVVSRRPGGGGIFCPSICGTALWIASRPRACSH